MTGKEGDRYPQWEEIMRYIIENEGLRVEADDFGAEVVSVMRGGKERLWQNENGAWAGHAPVLFPVCGNCAVVVDGRSYPMPKHGFARRSRFELSERGADFLRFTLRADAETKKLYPFDFEFTVKYTLHGNTLRADYSVDRPVPLSWGGHFSNKLFAPLSSYYLLFDREEDFSALLHDENGLLTGETRQFGRGRRLDLPEEGLQHGNTLIFGNIRSEEVTLCSPEGPLVGFRFSGFSHLLLWRPDGAQMLCVEPWGNLPDRAGGEQTELAQKFAPRTAAFQEITYD